MQSFSEGCASVCVRERITLKGSLLVLKLIPGTYFNHTGKPLKLEKKIIQSIWHQKVKTIINQSSHSNLITKIELTQNSTLHKYKAQFEDAYKALPSESAL